MATQTIAQHYSTYRLRDSGSLVGFPYIDIDSGPVDKCAAYSRLGEHLN